MRAGLMAGILAASGGGASVSIVDRTVSDIAIDPADAFATYSLNANGNAYDQDSLLLEAWLDSGSAGDFEVRATVTSGTLTTGTTGSWLALSTTRSWTKSQTSIGVSSCGLLIEIRLASTGAVQDSATITLTATVES